VRYDLAFLIGPVVNSLGELDVDVTGLWYKFLFGYSFEFCFVFFLFFFFLLPWAMPTEKTQMSI